MPAGALLPARGGVAYPGAVTWVRQRSAAEQNGDVAAAYARRKAAHLVRERGGLAWARHGKPGTKLASQAVSDGDGLTG